MQELKELEVKTKEVFDKLDCTSTEEKPFCYHCLLEEMLGELKYNRELETEIKIKNVAGKV